MKCLTAQVQGEALPVGLPARDLSKPAEAQGLVHKFMVHRTDGSSAPGAKHHGCEYFVLDVIHDKHAPAALAAYAEACKETHPELSHDLRERYALPTPPAAPCAEARDAAVQSLCEATTTLLVLVRKNAPHLVGWATGEAERAIAALARSDIKEAA